MADNNWHIISIKLYNFLINNDWVDVHESENFVYFNPPPSIKYDGPYLIKLPKYDLSFDFHVIIDRLINKLEILFDDEYKNFFKALRKRNFVTSKKYENKKNWIILEERNKINRIGIFEIYVPDL
jgi:hypothetical protein